MVITKKYPADSGGGTDGDSSRMVEHTIPLSRAEYDALNAYDGRKFKKRRFAYEVDGYAAEVDVYLDKLAGLVVIDFEFDSDEAMERFKKPDFAGADVTQEGVIAGGTLSGKSYADIAEHLSAEYGYEPVGDVEKFDEN
jgi:CYTH domain-containing protein